MVFICRKHICKFDNIDINIIQDNNNSHKNSSFNEDIKQQLKQKYEELFFDQLKSTKENNKIYIFSAIDFLTNGTVNRIICDDDRINCNFLAPSHS
jgi:hypothetical protein